MAADPVPDRCPCCGGKRPIMTERSLGIWQCQHCWAQWKMIRGKQK